MNKLTTSKRFFFCYNLKLRDYLINDCGLPYVLIAKNANNDKLFTLFDQTEALTRGIKLYKQGVEK